MARSRLVNRRRFARLSVVTGVQVVVQLLGFLAGLLVVHSTTTAQYALFTLLLAAVGLGNVLVDLGLASGAMAVAGRVHDQPVLFASALAQARALQRRMLAILLPLVVGVLVALLIHQQAAVREVLALAVLTAGIVWLNARNGLVLVGVRLRGQVALQQRLDLATSGLRVLVLVAVAMAALTIDAAAAAAITLGAAIVYALGLRGFQQQLAPTADDAAAPARRTELLTAVRRQAPHSIYFAFSSQIATGLIAWAGSAQQVAEVGALGRLGAMFVLVSSVSGALVMPYFARCKGSTEVAQGLRAVHLFFATLLGTLLLLGTQWPGLLLWLLGPSYRGLQQELPWLLAAGALTAWGGTLYGIGCVRGWVLPFAWAALGGVAAIAITATIADVATVRGVLAVNVAAALTACVLAAAFLAHQLQTQRKSST